MAGSDGFNMNPWAQGISIGGQILGAIGNAYTAKAQAQAQKFQYEMAASRAQFSADMNKLNAQIAASEVTRQQIQFAQQSALQGFQAAQRMANTRVMQSHSGVRMDSTSSQQVRANERFSRAVDMANTELNRIELLNQGQQQVTNYLSQATVNTGEASANSLLGAAISPQSAFNANLISGIGQIITNNAPSLFGNSGDVGGVDLAGVNETPATTMGNYKPFDFTGSISQMYGTSNIGGGFGIGNYGMSV